MNVRPPFVAPANVRRPFGAFRFDVTSLKAHRRISLYGIAALQGWIELEADPGIERLCERPLVIKDVKPQRIVDFWASGPGRNEFVFLLRGRELSADRRKPYEGAFANWANDVGCVIRSTPIERLTAAKERWLSDWTEILQCIAAYRSCVTAAQTAALKSSLTRRCRLGDLLRSTDCPDGDVGRAAAYMLVHQGSHRFVNLESNGLDDDVLLEEV